jgi:hypothetical protein
MRRGISAIRSGTDRLLERSAPFHHGTAAAIGDLLRDELFRLIPPRRRSQVVNEALRHALLRRKRRRQSTWCIAYGSESSP